jgi:hypothetical protein
MMRIFTWINHPARVNPRPLKVLFDQILYPAFLLVPIVISAASPSTTAYSDEPRTATTVGKWVETDQNRSLFISVSDLLTPSQREIVNSGFSTFTLLTMSDQIFPQKIEAAGLVDTSPTEKDSIPEFRLACSVKFDTWEERYQLIRMDPAPVKNFMTKDYKSWANECLLFTITSPELLNQLANGGSLIATLQIRQSSPDEGAKIKNWLVRQQSGFMQGLYAHMLGDFQFRGTIKVVVQVPPRPIMSSDAPSRQQPPKKGI